MNEKPTQSVPELSDNELLIQFRKGNEWAFRDLVNRYKNSLYAFLRRFINQQEVVEDVFQETFLQLYTSQDSFDTSRPLRPWLFTIAANKAKDALRKMQRQSTMSMGILADAGDVSIDEVVNILTSYDTTPDQEASRDETAQRVRQVISEMPENLRGILILAYFEQFSYKHMAEILSIPIGTVKSRLHTAVVHFMKKWKAANHGNQEL
ncbi:MAG: sigma-70 family RNA polymerase sigma factor [Planctomycetes bacterium]|nr:sigma-70 family RNA polymerase sigma factor [Planctomycetota bacterium]